MRRKSQFTSARAWNGKNLRSHDKVVNKMFTAGQEWRMSQSRWCRPSWGQPWPSSCIMYHLHTTRLGQGKLELYKTDISHFRYFSFSYKLSSSHNVPGTWGLGPGVANVHRCPLPRPVRDTERCMSPGHGQVWGNQGDKGELQTQLHIRGRFEETKIVIYVRQTQEEHISTTHVDKW